jgi:arylsulfatase A-like enzyme
MRILSAALTLACLPVSAAAPERLNILFCFADDWGRYASAYAQIETHLSPNQVIKTPNIDRLAREGVLFKNAYVNAPSCTPCRSALLSGRYFFGTGKGAILQGAEWDPAIPTYPLLLRDAGYHIGKSYKVWSPGTPADAPYGRQQYAYEKAGRDFCDFSENVTKLVKDGTPLADAKERMYAQIRQNFETFLAARPAGQPFCFWFGPTLTHRKWIKGSGKALWGIEPELLKGRLPKFLPDVPEVREDFADYLGESQAWDAGVGTLIKVLEQKGELDKTLVVVSGDHGAPGFPHGKCNLYDFGVNVALIARWPGGKGGRVVEVGGVKPPPGMHARSLVNVLKSGQSGLVDPARTSIVTGRERHVAAAREGNLPYPHRALRTKDFLYIRNFAPDRWPMGEPKEVTDTSAPSADALENNTFVAFPDMDASPTKAWLVGQRNAPDWKKYYDYAFGKRPAEELYDLRKDPDQINNLATYPDYANIRRQMSEQLLQTLQQAGDPRVTGDGLTFEKPPFSDPQTPAAQKATGKKAKAKADGK